MTARVPLVVGADGLHQQLQAGDTLSGVTASAGGSDRQLQYNNAGVLGGISGYTLDLSNNVSIGYASASTTPTADHITFEPFRIAASGGHVMPRYKNESAGYQTLQTHMARCDWIEINCTPGSSSLNSMGGTGGITAIGTSTIRAVDETTLIGRSKRMGYVSAATAGQAAGIINGITYLTFWSLGGKLNGGHLALFRWSVADGAAVAGAHMFVGMRNSNATPTVTVSPATYTNCYGIAQVAGSTNLQLVSGGTAAQAAIDLGANFPAADTTAIYEAIFYARPDTNNSVAYRVTNVTTGNSTSGILTGTAGTVLPANNILLGPMMWRSNNATALAVAIDLHRIYIEHNWEKV